MKVPEIIWKLLSSEVILIKVLYFRSGSNSQSQKIDNKQQQIIDAVKAQNEAIRNIGDDDNLEYDHQVVHDAIQPPNQRVQYNFKDAPVYFPNQANNWNQNAVPAIVSHEPYIPEHRIVHFDLKGAPPSIAYMKKVVTMSKRLGATGVLIEYEDMFPWTGRWDINQKHQLSGTAALSIITEVAGIM